MTPDQIKTFYGINKLANQGQGQTIAIIDAYDHPAIEADLAAFSTQFGLPACTTANRCFHKVYQGGTQPAANAGWALEIALDVEWAHAIAPKARILLIEATSAFLGDLFMCADLAAKNGATVVSMSFGIPEYGGINYFDSFFQARNVVYVASSGDNGHGVEYPASSPYVIGVGGTTVRMDATGAYLAETAWPGSGGGQSIAYAEPAYQGQAQSSGQRGVPDVAYSADPNTGFAVYCSFNGGWLEVGGTSAGTPQWAALFAIANSMRTIKKKFPLSLANAYLYPIAAFYRDITSGSDGACGAICSAGVGYDFVTGLGTPRADVLIPALVAMP